MSHRFFHFKYFSILAVDLNLDLRPVSEIECTHNNNTVSCPFERIQLVRLVNNVM